MGQRGVPTDSETPEGAMQDCRATGQEGRGDAELRQGGGPGLERGASVPHAALPRGALHSSS